MLSVSGRVGGLYGNNASRCLDLEVKMFYFALIYLSRFRFRFTKFVPVLDKLSHIAHVMYDFVVVILRWTETLQK